MALPAATYRLQLHAAFGFRDVAALVSYFRDLGISHLYLSPIFQARRGSTHGYDLTNPLALNPELGSPEDFEFLVRRLESHRMAIILDIVPNHMAASIENPWWFDVLEKGPKSAFASYFDIEWDPAQTSLEGEVLVPILGSPFGTALENQEIQLEHSGGRFFIRYHELRLPVAPWSYPEVGEAGGIDETLRLFNGIKGDPQSFDRLEQLLQKQPYRLAWWKTAKEKINYRRFFDITDLVGLRNSDPEVFRATHALLFRMARDGQIAGARVDHVDGLLDPPGYLERLRGALPQGSYIVVEKILEADERLADEWPVQGTTGYDFLNALNGLFVDPEGLERLTASYHEFTGIGADFRSIAYAQKKRIMDELFSGDMDGLAYHLVELTEAGRHSCDLSPREVSQALVEVTACLPVYRTYIRSATVRPADRATIETATADALARNPELSDALAFLRRVLLLEIPNALPFVMRWQQFTSPIAAKGVEDTALYLYNPLTSLNEVGGGPRARSADEFHAFARMRAARWPAAMNATSTHDTKRGEDTRARIHVISEHPKEWDHRLRRWSRWNPAPDKNLGILLYQALLGAWPVDDRDLTAFAGRIQEYALKAAREAKTHTSWVHSNEDFEAKLRRHLEKLLDNSPENRFLADFRTFQQKTAPHGAWNALGQTLFKIAAPGIPDFYQGTEIWDYSLVDPDNRRPVDFEHRQKLLATIRDAKPQELVENWRDGRIKIYLIERSLALRREQSDLFAQGEYIPLPVTGGRAAHAIAFARRHEEAWVIAIAPRLTSRFYTRQKPPLGRSWLDTALELPPDAPRTWFNILTGATVIARPALQLRNALTDFPVALLASALPVAQKPATSIE